MTEWNPIELVYYRLECGYKNEQDAQDKISAIVNNHLFKLTNRKFWCSKTTTNYLPQKNSIVILIGNWKVKNKIKDYGTKITFLQEAAYRGLMYL